MGEHSPPDEESPLIAEAREPANKTTIPECNGSAVTAKPRVLTIASIFIGAFLASVDTSLLLVNFDRIASEFHNMAYGPLILVSYNLGHSIALPVYGALGDMYGCKNVLLYAYFLFALGCALSGITSNLYLFLFGRLTAGIGGAGMLDLTSILICEFYDARKVAQVRSYLVATGTLGRSCGGPLGGLLTDGFGWRWTLAGQTPVAFMCGVFAWWQPSADKESTTKTPDFPREPWSSIFQKVDFGGILLFAVSMGSFTIVLDLGGQSIPWTHPLLVSLALVGGISGVAFFIVEWIRKEGQIIPPKLLLAPGLGSMYLGQALTPAALRAIVSSLAPYYSRIEKISATAVGMKLWPYSIGVACGSMIAGKIISRTRTYKKLSIISTVIAIISYLLMAVRWADGIKPLEIGYTGLMGFATGLFFAAQFTALMQIAPAAQLSTATGVYYLCQQVGVITGTAGFAALTQFLFEKELLEELEGVDKKQELVKNVLRKPDFAKRLSNELQSLIKTCYLHAYSHTLVLPLIAIIGVLPVVVFQKEKRLA